MVNSTKPKKAFPKNRSRRDSAYAPMTVSVMQNSTPTAVISMEIRKEM